jgi:hypothetical protein
MAPIPNYFAASILELKERYRMLPFAKGMKYCSGDIVGSADRRRWKPVVYRDFTFILIEVNTK